MPSQGSHVSIRAPRTRAGRRLHLRRISSFVDVSIRAPRTRAGRHAVQTPVSLQLEFQSAPRARARGDIFSAPNASQNLPVSIRAPRTRAGRLFTPKCSPVLMVGFNPRPAHARGATSRAGSAIAVPCAFQSAPRARARGDFLGSARAFMVISFQSAPRARARGDLHLHVLVDARWIVSIRAPRTRAGRPGAEASIVSKSRFQSAPRARARGDRSSTASAQRSICFNPRPAHARGATSQQLIRYDASSVSIRAPRTRAGRPVSKHHPGSGAKRFQSAPRARARGDIFICCEHRTLGMFQSAPRARARGDRRMGTEFPSVNRVSIRAPRTRAGRRRTRAMNPSIQQVSIRAPRTRAGRPVKGSDLARWPAFQSAPRARARGDLSWNPFRL